MAAFGTSSSSPSPTNRKRAKGKTAASLDLFPSADETFKDLLPRYPTAAALLRDPAPLRKGKWSKEEDELANACIQHFVEGLIPLSGVGDDTLRGLLSYMLHSDGMRVTKKFAGELSIRKVRGGRDRSRCSPQGDFCLRHRPDRLRVFPQSATGHALHSSLSPDPSPCVRRSNNT